MRINSTGQTALAKRAAMRRVDLYVVTTYTDRDAKTVASRLFWSDAARLYNYNREGTVREFLPVVRSRSGPQAETMLDIQDFGGSHAKIFELILTNRPTTVGGPYLLEQLRSRLFRATIEVIEVMLREDQDEADLSNLPGDEHTVAFRGELHGIVKADQDVFTVQFITVEPTVPWLYATGPYVDPDDLGRRLPIVYGSMPFVQAIGQEVGGETTASIVYPPIAAPTLLEVADVSRFQTAGDVFLDGELLNYSGLNLINLGLQIQARGQSGTSAAAHDIGASVVEARACKYIIAGHAITSLERLYARRTDGRLYEIPSTKYTANIADTTTVPGKTVATVTISKDQFVDIIKATHSVSEDDVNVTQQPSVTQQTTIKTLGIFDVGWRPGGSGGDVDFTVFDWSFAANASGEATFDPPIDEYPGAQSLPSEAELYYEGWSGSGPVDQSGQTAIMVDPAGNNDTIEIDVYVWFGVGAGYQGSLVPTGGTIGPNGLYGHSYDEASNPNAVIYGPVTTLFKDANAPFGVIVDLVELRERGISPDVVHMAFARQDFFSTYGPLSGLGLMASARATAVVLSTEQMTDVAIANTDASIVKAKSRRTTSPGSGSVTKLKVFATMRGYDLDEFPAIADHFIETVCGVTDGGDHSLTRPLVDASQGGLKHACDMRALGTSFAQIISRLAWESRANIVRTEGQITPASQILDLPALVLPGDPDTPGYLPTADDRPTGAPGFANTFTITILMLVPKLRDFDIGLVSSWVMVTDQVDLAELVSFGTSSLGKLLARVGDIGGGPKKVYEYDEPVGLTIDGGAVDAGHLPTLTLTWNGTTLKLWLDGTELTPSNIVSDDTVTMTGIPDRTIVVNGSSYEADRSSYFFGLAAWNVAMGATEIAAVGDLMRSGAALTANAGSYLSAANLKQHYRPGFAADPSAQSNSLVPTVPTGNGYRGTDGDALSTIMDTNTWDAARLDLFWAFLSELGTEDLTVTAVLQWGDAADMSDAATINNAYLTGGVPSDFDFTLVDGVLTTGNAFVRLFYDTTIGGAKRYLRWKVTVAGLGASEFISFEAFERFYDLGYRPGDATIRNDVAYASGGGSPGSEPPWELVQSPAVIPAIPGVTFYRYLCASAIADLFSYGFPTMNTTSEDLLGAIFDQYVVVSETPRDPATLKNRFRALFGMNEALGGPTDGAAFEQVIAATAENSAIAYPGVALLAQSEARWGKRDEAPMLFVTIQSLATAVDTLAFLAHVALRETRLWEFIGVPWEVAYQLDIGDTVAVPEVPWAPREAWLARVLGIARNPDTGMANMTVLGVQRRDAMRGSGTILVTGAASASHPRALAGAGALGPLISGAGTAIVQVSMTGAGSIDLREAGDGFVAGLVRAGANAMLPAVAGSGVADFTF